MNTCQYVKYFKWQHKKNQWDMLIFILTHLIASIFCLFIVNLRKIQKNNNLDFLVLYRKKNSYVSASLPLLLNQYRFAHNEHLLLPQILFSLSISKPSHSKFSIFYVYECYASYLIKKFNPKIIITERNGALLSPFLKRECSRQGIPVVHFASSLLTDNYRKYSMIDYDYYFIYGQSSFDKIHSRKIKLGQSKAILSGSIRINQKVFALYNHQTQATEENTFLLVGSGPSYELQESTKKFYSLIIDYVKDNPKIKLLFKPHPRSDLLLWNSLTQNLDKSKFAVIDYLNNNLKHTKLAFCGYTNAILDLALIGIPTILLSDENIKDVFDYELFFGKGSSSVDDFKNKIDFALNNYLEYKNKTKRFIEFHLASTEPERVIKNSLEKLLNKQKIKTKLLS